jgi:flagellar hook-associated protein 1 FlgK
MNQIVSTSLKAQQRIMETIANNLANAGVEGYSQREQPLGTNIVSGQNLGVVILPEQRIGDAQRTEDVRVKTIETRYLEVLSDFYNEIQLRFGEPDDKKSLGSRLTDLKATLAQLNDSPETPGNRNEVLRVLKETTSYINQLGDFFQNQRVRSANALTDSVKEVNRILQSLEVVNGDLSIAYNKNYPIGTYQDQQDALLKELSEYLDIQLLRRDDLRVDITLNSGDPLLIPTGATTLEFAQAVSIGPEDESADLGRILINGYDVTDNIANGKIGAYLYARDVLFPNMQAQFDEFTENLRDHLNALHNQGSGFPLQQTITGTRVVDGTDTMQMSGLVRIAVVDNATGNFVGNPLDLDLTGPADSINNIVAQINTHFTTETTGTAVLNADGRLELSAAAATHGFAIVSLSDPEAKETTTNLGFSHFFGMNDLLTTEDRFIDDGIASKAGLAQKLAVRSEIRNDANLISRGKLYTGNPITHPEALLSGDNTVLGALIQNFEAIMVFDNAGNMSSRQESLKDYANSIWHTAAIDAKNNNSDLQTQSQILEKSETELQGRTGVNIQEQIIDLMNAQQIYNTSIYCKKIIDQSFETLTSLIR